MNDDKVERSQLLRRLSLAKRRRPVAAAEIAEALDIDANSVGFVDFAATERLREKFKQLIEVSPEWKLRNRKAAIEFAENRILEAPERLLLFGEDFESTGAVLLETRIICGRCDWLSSSQGDCLRLLSDDEMFAVRLLTQEGAKNSPYFVSVFSDKSNGLEILDEPTT